MDCKSKSAKETIFRLLKDGFSIENASEKTGITKKVINIWKLQNDDFKKERITALKKILKFCESASKPVFSEEERILINEELTQLLKDVVLTDLYKYPANLKSKIELTISKFK